MLVKRLFGKGCDLYEEQNCLANLVKHVFNLYIARKEMSLFNENYKLKENYKIYRMKIVIMNN